MRPPHRRGEVYNFNGRIHPTHAPPHYHQTNISVLLRSYTTAVRWVNASVKTPPVLLDILSFAY